MFAHYRELVKPKDAERYWSIAPAKTENIVPMHMRTTQIVKIDENKPKSEAR